jgi:hypothetical protein
MTTAVLPAGTATGNADAVRQAPLSQFFYLVGDVMNGVDSQPRNEPGMSGGTTVGPSSTFGVDIGVGSTGEIFVRGRAGSEGAPADPAPPQASGVAGQLTPFGLPTWLVIGGLIAAAWYLSK